MEPVKGSNNFYMDITSISTGIYFLKIENGSSVTSKKIFIQ
ncbi:MAG: T9SS type A sorting domain-containing protein [Bacteroidia bacterium]